MFCIAFVEGGGGGRLAQRARQLMVKVEFLGEIPKN
jgi:hypothetical protein